MLRTLLRIAALALLAEGSVTRRLLTSWLGPRTKGELAARSAPRRRDVANAIAMIVFVEQIRAAPPAEVGRADFRRAEVGVVVALSVLSRRRVRDALKVQRRHARRLRPFSKAQLYFYG